MQITASLRTRWQLWAEFTLLYLGIPILMLVFLGQYSLFTTVWLLAAVSMYLLWRTPGFRIGVLWKGFAWRDLWIVAVFSAVTVLCTVTTVFFVVPERFLILPLERTQLWIMIMILYPVLSAWPQEIIFRTLFFERYGVLFASPALLIAVNAFVFGFGHLFFQNPITILMTGFAGAVMGWAYWKTGSLWLAWILHSLGGMIVFTSGLGVFFYHGAIGATP